MLSTGKPVLSFCRPYRSMTSALLGIEWVIRWVEVERPRDTSFGILQRLSKDQYLELSVEFDIVPKVKLHRARSRSHIPPIQPKDYRDISGYKLLQSHMRPSHKGGNNTCLSSCPDFEYLQLRFAGGLKIGQRCNRRPRSR